MKDIAPRGEDFVDLHPRSALENQAAHLFPAMVHFSDLLQVHRDFIFPQECGVLPAPVRGLAIGRHNHAGRVVASADIIAQIRPTLGTIPKRALVFAFVQGELSCPGE